MTKPKKITFEDLFGVIKTYNKSKEELEIIEKAYEYAKEKHMG